MSYVCWIDASNFHHSRPGAFKKFGLLIFLQLQYQNCGRTAQVEKLGPSQIKTKIFCLVDCALSGWLWWKVLESIPLIYVKDGLLMIDISNREHGDVHTFLSRAILLSKKQQKNAFLVTYEINFEIVVTCFAGES